MNQKFIDELRIRLLRPTADAAAIRDRFAPSHARRFPLSAPDGTRKAAVIVLLYPRDAQWDIPLLVRTSDLKHHRRQIALPGGAEEPGESPAETALRELEEELGVARSSVEVLGQLSKVYVPISGFEVHPCVGWTQHTPSFRPNRAEVAELLETP